MNRLYGQCLCKAVTFEVPDEFLYAMNCHCSNCRRTTGSAFKPIAGIEVTKLKVIAGSEFLMTYGDETARDEHCRQCGALIYSVVRDGQYAHVPMGVLAGDVSIRPTHHIFVGSKAPWFEITDTLPQHKELD